MTDKTKLKPIRRGIFMSPDLARRLDKYKSDEESKQGMRVTYNGIVKKALEMLFNS